MASAEEFDADKKKELKELFKNKDVDGSGTLDEEEFIGCLHLLGLYPTEEEVEFFMTTFDKNKDGCLQISELVENAHTLITHSLSSEDLIGAFRCLDRSGDGYIRYTELQKVLCHKGFMSNPECGKLISELSEKYDKDMDGKFSYTEFVQMFLSDTFQEKVVDAM